MEHKLSDCHKMSHLVAKDEQAEGATFALGQFTVHKLYKKVVAWKFPVYFFWAPHKLLAPQKAPQFFTTFATLERSSGYFSYLLEIPLFMFYRKIN